MGERECAAPKAAEFLLLLWTGFTLQILVLSHWAAIKYTIVLSCSVVLDKDACHPNTQRDGAGGS